MPRKLNPEAAAGFGPRLAQLRKAAGISQMALAAEIGCPIAEFPQVVKGLGLKPAERDKATNAVTLWRFSSTRATTKP